MDPITLMATAQTAYSALKTAIAAGKEIQGMAGDLSSLWGSVAEIVKIAHGEVSVTTVVTGKTPEEIAMERFAAKQKALEMSQEIKNKFVGTYGLNAWDSVQAEVVRIRKETEQIRLEQERLREKRRREMMAMMETAVIAVGCLFIALVVIGGAFVLMVHSR